MDNPSAQDGGVAILVRHWQQKLAAGASVYDLADYLYDHSYHPYPINALKVIRDASGLSLIESVDARDTVWSRRKAIVICQDMLVAGHDEEVIRACLHGYAFSDDELQEIMRSCSGTS